MVMSLRNCVATFLNENLFTRNSGISVQSQQPQPQATCQATRSLQDKRPVCLCHQKTGVQYQKTDLCLHSKCQGLYFFSAVMCVTLPRRCQFTIYFCKMVCVCFKGQKIPSGGFYRNQLISTVIEYLTSPFTSQNSRECPEN